MPTGGVQGPILPREERMRGAGDFSLDHRGCVPIYPGFGFFLFCV
jgi:hypothetical protein